MSENVKVEKVDEKDIQNEEGLKLKVKIGTKELFHFLFTHTYTSPSGIIGLCVSIGSLVLLAMGFAEGDDFRMAVLAVMGSLFTVFNPIMLWVKAKGQAVKNPLYKNELIYILSDTGVSLIANGKKETIEWNKIIKCKRTKTVYLLYTTKIHAILLPVAGMTGQKEQVDELITTKVRGK